MKIAAAQMEVTDSKENNLQKMLEYIKRARHSDVICFPEICLQCDETKACSIEKELKILCTSAAANNINIIFGAYVNVLGKIKNRIFVINKEGLIIHKYDKKHPYISEAEYLSKGRNNKPFTIDGVPCAVINCWDYAFPEFGRNLAQEGAKIIFCPSYLMSFPRTKSVLIKIPQVRAFDYMSFFVMVDAFTGETFKRSKICHPLYLIKSIKDTPGIIYATIDPDEIDALRKDFQNFRKKTVVSVHTQTENIIPFQESNSNGK